MVPLIKPQTPHDNLQHYLTCVLGFPFLIAMVGLVIEGSVKSCWNVGSCLVACLLQCRPPLQDLVSRPPVLPLVGAETLISALVISQPLVSAAQIRSFAIPSMKICTLALWCLYGNWYNTILNIVSVRKFPGRSFCTLCWSLLQEPFVGLIRGFCTHWRPLSQLLGC